MNVDLEKQLDEMGPAYRAVVARLRAAREAGGSEDFRHETRDARGLETRDARRDIRPLVFRLPSQVLGRPAYLAAASLLVLAGLAIHFTRTLDIRPKTQGAKSAPREYRASVSEMIATQNPDGSWQSDFLTRRNADALKDCADPAAQIAYRKAVRNLRVRGVL